MTIIELMTAKIKSLIYGKRRDGENFFDYSLSEKKRIIDAAAKNAAKMKRDTIEKYNLAYGSK